MLLLEVLVGPDVQDQRSSVTSTGCVDSEEHIRWDFCDIHPQDLKENMNVYIKQ